MLETALGHHRAGRLAEAETIYRQILAVDAHHADSLHLLGMIEHQRGHHEMAISMIRAAIASNPTEAAYHSNLGAIHQTQGRLDEAAACFERALILKPDGAEVHSNYGNILQARGKLEEAAACHERALALRPEFAEACSNLGNVRYAQGQLAEALVCYERALALKLDYPDAHNNLGAALLALDRIDEAVAHLKRALTLKPDFASAHNNLGNALLKQGLVEDARSHYERALILNPDYANAHNNLANLFKEQGKFDDALEHYGRAIAIQPDYAEAHLNRADIKSFQPGDPNLAALEALNPPPDRALYIHFALAKALDDVKDYGRAFEHLRQGNALKRERIDYDETATLQQFERISAVFHRGLFDRFQGAGDPSSVPIFVLGMPRSGSTLIEQILASHPQVHAAGELTILEKSAFDATAFRRLGQLYLSQLPKVPGGKLRIVDKLPGNFLRIGLIHLMLPNARIIHTMRNPIDTCLSCYSKLFNTGLPFTYDLAELGRYYRAYSELMNHWRSVLPPGVMLDVSYEDVIDDLEGQARRLIDYCGLPWDPGCIDFHRNNRSVRTASAVQVRQPLFRGSVQRWRNYEFGLAPLLDELALGGAAVP
jgi:tetratricopeptide (TPR) repeat protein